MSLTSWVSKTVLVPDGEVLVGFKHNFIASKGKAYRYLNKIRKILERFKMAASIHNNSKNF